MSLFDIVTNDDQEQFPPILFKVNTEKIGYDQCQNQTKGQLNSEPIYEVIVSSKMPTKNWKDFCPGSLLEGRAEILKIFWLAFWEKR